MSKPVPFDIDAFAKDVAQATFALSRYRRALEAGEKADDPFFGRLRATSQKSVYDALESDGTPFARALLPHVGELLRARLRLTTEVPLREHRGAATVRVTLAGERPKTVFGRDVTQMLAQCTHVDDVRTLTHAAAELGRKELGLAKAHRDLGLALEEKLGEEPSLAPRVLPAADGVALALATLTLLADVPSSLPSATLKSDYADLLFGSFAHEAGRELPRRVGPRNLVEWAPPFATAWLDPKSGEPSARQEFSSQKPLAAPADIARLLGALGRAYVSAHPLEGAAWAVVRRPRDLRRHALGALFAALPGRPAFARRAFGFASGAARDEARHYLRSQLFFLRRAALRTVISPMAPGASVAGEMLAKALAPLPSGAEEILLRRDAETVDRFVGLAMADGLESHLQEFFDEDWFRNPRAATFLLAALHDPSDTWFPLPAPSGSLFSTFLERAKELL